MKQKRNSHIRKSNYHPPKTQTEKPVTKIDSQSKRRAETVSSKKNKTASPLKGTARRQLPEKYPLPGRLIFWKRILKNIISGFDSNVNTYGAKWLCCFLIKFQMGITLFYAF